jgi:ABC-type nitrate/sulfonate/bicarbonate transport system permease component
MAISANLEQQGEPRPSRLAKLYLDHERLLIGGGTLAAFLLLWQAFGESGLIDPLFISSPTRVLRAGYGLMHDRDFWNDLGVSGSEFILGYGAAVALAFHSASRSDCQNACNTCWVPSSTRSTRCRASPCCR